MKLCKDIKLLDHLAGREVVQAYGQIDGYTYKYKGRKEARCSLVNQVSRATIRAMKPCYIVKVNLYGDERKKKDHILTEYRKGMVYNFAGSIVIPAHDEKLIELIHQRDIAPYTGTGDDAKRITEIYNHIEKIGGKTLHWT
jgi:hypothetical protein